MKINNTLIKKFLYNTLRIRSVELEISKGMQKKNEMPNSFICRTRVSCCGSL